MKISKTAVLTVGSALMIAGLGLLFVSASDSFPSKTLVVDPNNAVQQFVRVRIVPTESGDNSMADIVKKGNLFGIETDYNFALSRTGTEANQISGNSMGSSILGGIINRILGGIYNGILGGKNNEISTGNNNGILGGENNKIDAGNYSVIFGGKGNKSNGSYLSIVGGSGNTANSGNYLVVVGRNNVARGYNSVVMGSGSKLDATASFLWTDGSRADALKNDHVFAVLGDNGMVINATGAHELAQLTISGSLVVYDDKNAPECTQDTKGVLKVVTGNDSTSFQECFCSCDGSGRNVLHEGTWCEELCKDDNVKESPECGDVVEDCSRPYHYTGSSVTGACAKGQLVRGTGAFFVNSIREGTGLINYINRSCQIAGEITGCQKKLVGDSCPNLFTGYECLGEKEGHWLTKDHIKPRDSATHWEYSATGYRDGVPCKYDCDQWSHWDSRQEKCIPNACGDLNDSHAHMNNSNLPTEDGKEPEYDPGSSEACTYDCDDGYGYKDGQCERYECEDFNIPNATPNSRSDNPTDFDQAYEYEDPSYDNGPCTYHCDAGFSYKDGQCERLECEDFNIPNATPNSRSDNPTHFDQAYEYEDPSYDNSPCTYHCEDGFSYKDGKCELLACVGKLPDNTELVHPTLKPTDPDTKIFYKPDSDQPCAYKCRDKYIRSGDNCVLNLKNCSVGLRESATSTSAKTLSSSYTVSNLGSSNVWSCDYTNDGTVKLFADVCDDEVQSFDTSLGSITMNQGYKFEGWYVDGVLKSSDLNNGLNLNCGDVANLKWDCDEENDYERYNGYCVKKTGGECTVTYDLGDGKGKGGQLEGRSSNTEIVNCGTEITLPNATWDRHGFLGWYDTSLVGGAGGRYTVWRDVTLKAHWGEYTCNGSVPENANFVEGSDSDLDGYVDRKVYPYAEIFDSDGKYKGTVKCAYSCKPGYIAYEGKCVPCQVGSWDESDPDHCAANIECGDNEAWDKTLGKCATMGTCRKSGGATYKFYSSSTINSVLGNVSRPTTIKDLLPLPGEGDKYFECVDDRDGNSNVSENSCQYKCQEGSYCNSYDPPSCIEPYCNHLSAHGFYTGGTPSLDQVSATTLNTSSVFVENINNEQEFYDYVSTHQPGCYFRCPEKNRWRGCNNNYSSYRTSCYSDAVIQELRDSCDDSRPSCATINCHGFCYKNEGNPEKNNQSWTKWDSESEAAKNDCAFACKNGAYYTKGYYVTSEGTLSSYSDTSHFCRKQCGSDQSLVSYGCSDCPPGTILDTSGPSVTLTDESSGITITQYTTCKAIECPSGTQLSLPEGKTCKSSLQDGKCPSDMPNGKMINGECKICLDPTKTITDSGECI